MIRSATLLIASVLLSSTLPGHSAAGQASVPAANRTNFGENQFGADPTLFTTLAAINAAGYDYGLDSPLNERFRVRTQVREEVKKLSIPSLPDLKTFYQAHRKPNGTAELSQYISFALTTNGPPTFEPKLPQLPPDVEALTGFSTLLARFYKEAHIDDLWKRTQPAIAQATAEYQGPVITNIFEANGYLRNPTSGYLGRRFQIFLDLLGAPDQVQVRNYRDDSYIVITPSSMPVVEEIRDAYLAYLLDPLTFKYTTVIDEKKTLSKYAQEAPTLDLAYKDNFSLLVTKCLIKAVDARLLHGDTGAKDRFVNEQMREGYILTAAFAELLPKYEKQDQAMRLYYPDLVSAIDVRKEQKRLKEVQFAQSLPARVVAPPAVMQLPPAEVSLQTAEGLYEQKDFANASRLFKKVFEQTTEKSMQGRAYYGLARIAVQENKKDEALELFGRTAESSPNPPITAWSHVYLGRLELAAGEPEKATDQFKLALTIEGASQKAREAAEKGLQSISGEQQK